MAAAPETDKRNRDAWLSAQEYRYSDLPMNVSKFEEISNLLLERPNLNSTHLFRADVLADSTGKLQTVIEKDRSHHGYVNPDLEHATIPGSNKTSANGLSMIDSTSSCDTHSLTTVSTAPENAEEFAFPGFTLVRTVVRRLVPRKPQLDRLLEQTCFIYKTSNTKLDETSMLVVYIPHVSSSDQIPWYHPKVRALAYRYECSHSSATLSIHYKLFPHTNDELSSRLHRTFLSLLQTFVRLSKLETPRSEQLSTRNTSVSALAVNAASLKDTIIPQHVVQDTYTKLKQKYAADLIARWVEATEPSKHVFEDIAIAAFLIELWKSRYSEDTIPKFIDIACGNGVLVYILIKEGYRGRGFDARRRKTWEVLQIDQHLEQKLCIPKPFLNVLDDSEIQSVLGTIDIHNGIFEPGTFIISNHADELTPWTPIMAALSCADTYLPFLSIPCCSHALSGAKRRYTLHDVDAGLPSPTTTPSDPTPPEHDQPSTGDLKALRAQKTEALSHSGDKSTYACLTKKTVALAEELGFDTEMTLMRIPSTRNIGIVGKTDVMDRITASDRVAKLLQRECGATGGIKASAQAWIERARKHIEGQGRGKVNLRCDKATAKTVEEEVEEVH